MEIYTPVQAGTCRYKGSVEQAVGMTYYRLIQDGEDDILKTVAEHVSRKEANDWSRWGDIAEGF